MEETTEVEIFSFEFKLQNEKKCKTEDKFKIVILGKINRYCSYQ